MARKKTFQILREAPKLGPYDERPMLPDDIDVQLHLSRNDRPQPFHLICEKDTLLAQISGRGRVEFRSTSVTSFALGPGDYVYVPAGTPHRLMPDSPSVTLRYKPALPGLEAVAWFCPGCGGELARETWDTVATVSQSAYLAACERFNADAVLRRCAGCGAAHEPVDLSPYRWAALADEIRAERAAP